MRVDYTRNLHCRHSNQDTWKKTVKSQHFLKKKDPQVPLQMDQGLFPETSEKFKQF